MHARSQSVFVNDAWQFTQPLSLHAGTRAPSIDVRINQFKGRMMVSEENKSVYAGFVHGLAENYEFLKEVLTPDQDDIKELELAAVEELSKFTSELTGGMDDAAQYIDELNARADKALAQGEKWAAQTKGPNAAADAAEIRKAAQAEAAAWRSIATNNSKGLPFAADGADWAKATKLLSGLATVAERLGWMFTAWQLGDKIYDAAQGEATSHDIMTETVKTFFGGVATAAILSWGGVAALAAGPALLLGAAAIGIGYAVGKGFEWAYDTYGQPFTDFLADIGKWLGENLYDITHPEWVDPAVNALYEMVRDWRERIFGDPLALDLDGDGIETRGADGQVVFDLDADGLKTGTGWIRPDDGLLVLDRNQNGVIDDGRELFGDQTVLSDGNLARDGFEALADLDSNKDGQFDANDAQYGAVRIWRDLNQDGISQSNELLTMVQADIASINLDAAPADTNDGNNNNIVATSSFERISGGNGQLGAASFQFDVNPFFSEFVPIELSERAKSLPEMHGSGMVRDMREAATLSTAFADQLEAYAGQTTRTGQRQMLDALIQKWAATSTMVTSANDQTKSWAISFFGDCSGVITPPDFQWTASTTAIADFAATNPQDYARIIALEQLNGSTMLSSWIDTVAVDAVPMPPAGAQITTHFGVEYVQQRQEGVAAAWDALRESVYDALIVQTRFQDLLDQIKYIPDENAGLRADFTPLTTHFQQLLQTDKVRGISDLIEFHRYTAHVTLDMGWDGMNLESLLRETPVTPALQLVYDDLRVQFGSAGTPMEGSGRADVLLGGASSTTLDGDDGDDMLLGGTGGNTLYGGDGEDRLDGGAGADVLYGGNGRDVYIYGRGYGVDTIINQRSDFARGDATADIIRLKSGVDEEDVAIFRNGDDLILKLDGGNSDTLQVRNFFEDDADSQFSLRGIIFANGVMWSLDEIKQMVNRGTPAADLLQGYAGNDVLTGDAGNDVLYGRAGDDQLDGGSGNDNLFGDSGNDSLTGGSGNDMLDGGLGADEYRFAIGDGADTIADSGNDSVQDALILQGLNNADIQFARKQDDLVLTIRSSGETLTIDNYFVGDGANGGALERIQFADGQVIDYAGVRAQSLLSGTGDDYLSGFASSESIAGGTGNDIMFSGGGKDTLQGDAGNDSLQGGVQSSTLIGGEGDDLLQAGAGGDLLQGGNGWDSLFGGNGADTLDAGTGGGNMEGGGGSDVYRFIRGSGKQVIIDAGGSSDTLEFGAGIGAGDLLVSRTADDDLRVQIKNTSDFFYVHKFFANDVASANVIERFKLVDGTVASASVVKSMVTNSTSGDDYLAGYASNDTLSGGTGADELHGAGGNDSLLGGTQNDSLYGEAGSDTLGGGSGDDYLSGGVGNDVYLFAAGEGRDVIVEGYVPAGTPVESNTIRLAADINASSLIFTRDHDALLISISGTADSLYIQHYFSAPEMRGNADFALQFGVGGAIWGRTDILARVVGATDEDDVLRGSSAAETLAGSHGDDQIYADAGDDSVSGGDGRDTLMEGEGNDTVDGGNGNDYVSGENGNDSLTGGNDNDDVYGDGGNDTLSGGRGNDMLSGGDGSDLFLFNAGDGQDTLHNYDYTNPAAAIDVLQFGAGITEASVRLDKVGNDLLLSINDTRDAITLRDYFAQGGTTPSTVETIKFASSTTWNYSYVSTHLSAAIPAGQLINGTDANNTLSGGAGPDTVHGFAGADSLSGGSANDRLNGGDGNDTLVGGSGHDSLDGGAGIDTYVFATGSGCDVVLTQGAYAGNDIIQLGNGITTSNISLKMLQGALLISVTGYQDQLRVETYRSQHELGNAPLLKFADSTQWNSSYVMSLVSQPTAGHDDIQLLSSGSLDALAGDDSLHGSIGADTLSGGLGKDSLFGAGGNDLLQGGANNDYLFDNSGNNSLLGGGGNDTLIADSGNDTLDGGAGNDTMTGGAGNDVYQFGLGSGNDTINAADATLGKLDILQLGAGISSAQVLLSRQDDDLILRLSHSSDSLTVRNYFTADAAGGSQLERIVFADSTFWDVATVKSKVVLPSGYSDTLIGYAGDDTLSGGNGISVYFGRAGNDSLSGAGGDDGLHGEAGHDTLRGGSGDDMLQGGSGNDLLDGGAGDDLIYGNDGADIYRFGRGYGNDMVYNYDSNPLTPGDSIELGSGILPSDIRLWRTWNNGLYLEILGTSDSLVVYEFFTNDGQGGMQVERINFVDGTVWDFNTIRSRALLSTENDDWITGLDGTANTLSGGAGNDVLSAGAQADSLSGGNGDDVLNGYQGKDTLRGGQHHDLLGGGEGNDSLFGDEGRDRLDGGEGDDWLVGGEGADTLSAGAGNDVYVFGRGSGWDLIINDDSSGTDSVQFGDAVLPADILLEREGNDLTLAIKGSADRLVIQDHYLGGVYQIDQFKFTGGPVWTWAAISPQVPTTQNDSLTGTANDDYIRGLAGNDRITALAGNDELNGGSGMDTLLGGQGNDRYLVDHISDSVSELLGEGSDTVQAWVNWTLGDHVEVLELAGTAGIEGTGNALANRMSGNSGDNRLVGRDGNDTLTAGDGKDTLDGGVGTDSLVGGKGDDLYILGDSSDVLLELAGEGRDTVYSMLTTTLGAQLEDLLLLGDTAINGTGNALDNGLTGNKAANLLSGGDGSDALEGGGGKDTLDGGSGSGIDIAVYSGHGSAITVNLGTLGDQTLASGLINSLIGIEGVVGTRYNDTLVGNGLANVLDGGAGNDTLTGGAGADVYTVNSLQDVVVESSTVVSEIDQVHSSVNWTLGNNLEQLFLLGQNDLQATGNGASNLLSGNGGNNVLQGLAGNDSLLGGGGNDTLDGGSGNDTLDGGSGIDTASYASATAALVVSLAVDTVQLTGGAGDDRLLGCENLTGGAGNDSLTGNDQANRLDGSAGVDTLVGGHGNDTYIVNQLGESIVETGTIDSAQDNVQAAVNWTLGSGLENLLLSGTSAVEARGNQLTNSLTGNSAANQLYGLDGADTLYGMAGGDTLDGGLGADSLVGGAGNDTYVINELGDVIVEDGRSANEVDTVQSSISWALASTLEHLTLTGSAAINATGNHLANVLTGNGAVNLLSGGAGNDSLDGGAGNDSLLGGSGNDQLNGGLGFDFVLYGAQTSSLVLNLSSSAGQFIAGAGTDTLLSIEGVESGAGDDVLVGSSVANVLHGAAGNDRLDGAGDNDTLIGGEGNDTLDGGLGNNTASYQTSTVSVKVTLETTQAQNTLAAGTDTLLNIQNLLGGSGNDSLIGNAQANLLNGSSGNDSLLGGAGSDSLRGGAGTDTLAGGTGGDTYQFQRGHQMDVISENDTTAGATDVLSFMQSNVSVEQIWFRHVGNDLEVSIIGSTDTAVVKNWYLGSAYRIEQFRTADGQQLLAAQVEALVTAMAAQSTTVPSTSTLPPAQQAALGELIAASWN